MPAHEESISIELVPPTSTAAQRYTKKQRALWTAGIVVLVPLVIILQFLMLKVISPDELLDPVAWREVFSKVRDAIAAAEGSVGDKLMWVAAVLAFPGAIVASSLRGKPKLIVGADEIKKTGARLDEFLGRQLNWSIQRVDIEQIALKDSQAISDVASLTISLRSGSQRTIRLSQWVDAGKRSATTAMRELLLFRGASKVREHSLSSPLVTALKRFGYDVDVPEDTVLGFDLLTNKTSVVSVFAILAAIGATVLAIVTPSETYVAGYPILLFFICGVVVGAISCALNLLGDVPREIALGVGFTAGVVAAAAAYPALLRVNSWTDPVGLQSVPYVHDRGYEYRAIESDWRTIQVPAKIHWANVDTSEPITVPIRRGGLGFYQANFRGLMSSSDEFREP